MKIFVKISIVLSLALLNSCESEEVKPELQDLTSRIMPCGTDPSDEQGPGDPVPCDDTTEDTRPLPPCGDLMGLARYYAPIMIMHHEEQHFPSSVGWYLPHVRMRIDASDYRHHAWSPITEENMDDIRGFGQNSASYGNRFYVSPEGLSIDGDSWLSKGDLSSTEIYVHFREVAYSNGETDLDIQYWIFYPFNDAVDLRGLPVEGDHEGDWEHVTVRLKGGCQSIRAIYLSAHGDEVGWVDPRHMTFYGDHPWSYVHGRRPFIYAARGSHAFYTTAGVQNREWILEDYTGGGERVNFKDRLVLVADDTGTTPNFTSPGWINYKGRWGETRDFLGVQLYSGAPSPKSLSNYWVNKSCDICPNEMP